MSWLVVRVRSGIKVRKDIKATMDMLNLTRVNHATIVPKTDAYLGMLRKAKDYITWGHADAMTIEMMMRERGRITGDAHLDDDHVAGNSDYPSIEALASAIEGGEATVRIEKGLKPVFRLHPPRGTKGWGGIKRAYSVGGALGHRKDGISELIARMV